MTDKELTKHAQEIITSHYDGDKHTVGAALLGESGKVYAAVNLFSLPLGTCAEPIVLGRAISEGEKKFIKIACVRGLNGEVLPPCGNCRQVLMSYAPDIKVVVTENNSLKCVSIQDLLPLVYRPLE